MTVEVSIYLIVWYSFCVLSKWNVLFFLLDKKCGPQGKEV